MIAGGVSDFKQRRLQRQRKRHMKIKVSVPCTSSRLFQLVQLGQCGQLIPAELVEKFTF